VLAFGTLGIDTFSALVEPPALSVSHLTHRYGTRVALDDVSFEVPRGEFLALLGPNGGGKSTLFRICATLMRPTSGAVAVFGNDVETHSAAVRRQIGVVFQSPALDQRLTVRENLRHHGRLYRLERSRLGQSIDAALARVSLGDRADELVLKLSGGLKRRAEIAKVLMTRPALLLLDEPTTGLDPGIRRDLWRDLAAIRAEDGSTIVVTTHLLDEADAADRVAIIDRGRIVVDGSPAALTRSVGGDVVRLMARSPGDLANRITARFQVKAAVVDDEVRVEHDRAHVFAASLVDAFPGEIRSVQFGRPTLEDVFVRYTGRRFE
jgi:ABC-2 type transport system ATP-binding protein